MSIWMGENCAGLAVRPSYLLFIKTVCGKYCFIFRDVQAILPSHVCPCGKFRGRDSVFLSESHQEQVMVQPGADQSGYTY